jgi:DNA polymerase elongation subunit (family B)
MDEINDRLKKKCRPAREENYWICKLRKGAFPTKLVKLLTEREYFQKLLKQELTKSKEQQKQELINYYEARQLALKLLANGRLIHKKMEDIGFECYGFQTVFGFTDSIFVRHDGYNNSNKLSDRPSSAALNAIEAKLEAVISNNTNRYNNNTEEGYDNISQYLNDCQHELRVRLEHKNRFMFTIIFDKKNRYVAWTGNIADRPILKNLSTFSVEGPIKIIVQIWLGYRDIYDTKLYLPTSHINPLYFLGMF